MTEQNPNVGGNDMASAKEARLFRRIVGLFLLFYAFLMLSQPLLYGFGFNENVARLIGLALALVGIYLAIKS